MKMGRVTLPLLVSYLKARNPKFCHFLVFMLWIRGLEKRLSSVEHWLLFQEDLSLYPSSLENLMPSCGFLEYYNTTQHNTTYIHTCRQNTHLQKIIIKQIHVILKIRVWRGSATTSLNLLLEGKRNWWSEHVRDEKGPPWRGLPVMEGSPIAPPEGVWGLPSASLAWEQ